MSNPQRRRSSYGHYVATGLIGDGGELEPGTCECCDEARSTLDERAADTYRRVVMRHQMRTARAPLGRCVKPSAKGRR